MDLGTIIIAVFAIAIFISPFLIVNYIRAKKERRMLQALTEIAARHDCKISQSEFCSDSVIGLDTDKNFVFFYKELKENTISQFADLARFQNCQVVKKTKTIKNGSESTVLTERVDICLIPADRSESETRFDLYSEGVNMHLSGELQFAEKWSKQIRDRLSNKKQ